MQRILKRSDNIRYPTLHDPLWPVNETLPRYPLCIRYPTVSEIEKPYPPFDPVPNFENIHTLSDLRRKIRNIMYPLSDPLRKSENN